MFPPTFKPTGFSSSPRVSIIVLVVSALAHLEKGRCIAELAYALFVSALAIGSLTHLRVLEVHCTAQPGCFLEKNLRKIHVLLSVEACSQRNLMDAAGSDHSTPGEYWASMASSEVDQKFLGRLAKAVEPDNPLLGSVLFKLLGLSLNLAQRLIRARKQRKLQADDPHSVELYLHIIWLSREGCRMLEQYVLPMVGNYVELKVLAYKLRASFFHIFVSFHNQPPVSRLAINFTGAQRSALDKGKGVARNNDPVTYSVLEGGPVAPPPGFGPPVPELAASFLMPSRDFLPEAHGYFQEAVGLANDLLWGSHSLRLSVKTEYSAFLYECVHDAEESRKLAKDTIAEAYDAVEPMDDDMFNDACELVTVLGKMMKRGLGSNNTLRTAGPRSAAGTSQAATNAAPEAAPPPGMENPI